MNLRDGLPAITLDAEHHPLAVQAVLLPFTQWLPEGAGELVPAASCRGTRPALRWEA